jgi:hypothetical protein
LAGHECRCNPCCAGVHQRVFPDLILSCLFTPEMDKETSLSKYYFFIDTGSSLPFDEGKKFLPNWQVE